MKKSVIIPALLALVLASPALAGNHDHDHNHAAEKAADTKVEVTTETTEAAAGAATVTETKDVIETSGDTVKTEHTKEVNGVTVEESKSETKAE